MFKPLASLVLVGTLLGGLAHAARPDAVQVTRYRVRPTIGDGRYLQKLQIRATGPVAEMQSLHVALKGVVPQVGKTRGGVKGLTLRMTIVSGGAQWGVHYEGAARSVEKLLAERGLRLPDNSRISD